MEYKTTHTFSAPKTNKTLVNRIDFVSDFEKNIRRKVHQFFFTNELPTRDNILMEVNNDPVIPNFKTLTFHKLLMKLNLKYQKCERNSLLINRDEIVLWRRYFLKKLGLIEMSIEKSIIWTRLG